MKLCDLRNVVAGGLVLLVGLTSTEVSASVLFQNQWSGPSKSGNASFIYYIGAENFSLTNAYSIESLTFEALTEGPIYNYWSSSEYLAKPIDRDSLMIDWSIWASGGDKPSGTTALFSGSMAPSLTDMGNCTTCYKRIEYLLDVPDFNLAAGDYWVGFHVTRGFEGLYWAQTANGDTKTASGYVSNSGTAWYPGHPNSSNYPPEAYVFSVRGSAASVSSVPEPETYTMVLAGLGLIGAIARRRRASRA